MKTIVALVLALATTAARADDCSTETSAAVSFMNAYLRYSNDRTEKRTNQSTAHWLQSSGLVTPRMKAADVALQREGLKQDPELGWDIDLIVDAQDAPDDVKGMVLVDGAGRANLPESQRARR